MYLSAFWVGVFVTLFVEMAALIAAAVVKYFKKR